MLAKKTFPKLRPCKLLVCISSYSDKWFGGDYAGAPLPKQSQQEASDVSLLNKIFKRMNPIHNILLRGY